MRGRGVFVGRLLAAGVGVASVLNAWCTALAADRPLRFLVIGGGATPESTEVSLEQDVVLAGRVLRGPGSVFFAGGSDALSVRTLDPTLDTSSVLVRVGELFAPRAGRGSRYRKSSIAALPARRAVIEQGLARSLAQAAGDPLLVYVASHGEQGETPRDNRVVLWGGDALSVAQLDAATHAAPRPVRYVIASCFSGGFAELAFERADARAGVTQAARCGLFAGTWDRETAGCDPNPDRRAQEGYSLHFFHALRGEDRDGQPLAAGTLDLDGDGRIGLLEAHTRARIAGVSIDVPTTTSERFLRHVQKAPAAKRKLDPKLLPEEHAVRVQLGARLGLLTRRAVEDRLAVLDRRLDELDRALSELELVLDEKHAALSALLLARWPMLDDAYHPDFAPALARDAARIRTLLDASPEARAYDDLAEQLAQLDERFSQAQAEEAVALRLLRAYETLELASALAARGGQPWASYTQLLECERWVP
jgi:hypothetical protein